MPQTTRRWISEMVQSLRGADVLPSHDILDAKMVNAAPAEEGVTFGERIYTPLVTLCLFLSQVLDPDHSCRAAVARPIVWLAINGRKPRAPDTGRYRDARQRLPAGVITRLVRQTAREIEGHAPEGGLWKGRRASLVDGTTASMPDTPENQRAFPQSESQGVGLGFPLVRIVALLSLATRVVQDLASGPYQGKETGETALFRTLGARLGAGDVVLGDRYFASFHGIAGLAHRGVDGLFRMHQRRKFDFRRGGRLAIEDHVVAWIKPARPPWMDEEPSAQVPTGLQVRELRITVTQPGSRANEPVLVTTPIDGEAYTKEELANPFLQRWTIEPESRSIKDVLQMDVLRCKSPEMVEKEIWKHSLAYDPIRGVMAKAAEAHDERPRHLSFKGASRTMMAFQDVLRGRRPASERTRWRRCSERSRATRSVTDSVAWNLGRTSGVPSRNDTSRNAASKRASD